MRTTVADVMTTDVIAARPDTPFRELAEMLTSRHISAVPVVDVQGRLLGIVTRGDLLAVFLRRDGEIREEIIQEVMIRTLWMDPARIDIGVTSGVVSLRGRVDRRSDIDILVGFIRGVEGVVAVRCELGFAYDDVRGAMSAAWRAVI